MTRLRATTAPFRAAALGTLLLAVYCSTLGLDAFAESDYGGDEPHYLLAATSLVEDGDLDVLDDFGSRTYAGFYPYDLDRHGEPRGGALREPHGAGFPALIAPAFALGGATAVELFLAVLAASALALSYLLARRAVPDPYALGAALAVGLSPPFLAYGSAVYPELAAGGVLAGAALLALRLRERPSPPAALGCASLLALLPWLGTKFVPAGIVVGAFAIHALRAGRRRLLAIAALQVAAASAIAFVLVNQSLYGAPTPYGADVDGESATEATFPWGYLERVYRLAALLVDRDYGLLRWAPVFALALVGAWLAARPRTHERREAPAVEPGAARIALRKPSGQLISSPGRFRQEDDCGHDRPSARTRYVVLLCGGVLLAQLIVAAFAAPTMFGFWFPPRHLLAGLPLAVPLVALGIRRFPRTGAALAAVGAIGSAWVWLAVRFGDAGLAAGRPDAPFGPLDAVFPYYGTSPLPYAVTGAVVLGLAALAARPLVERMRAAATHARQTAGATRRRYSG